METVSESAGYWRTFFEGSPDGVILLQAVRAADGSVEDFVWLDANPRAREIAGDEPGDRIGVRLLAEDAEGAAAEDFDRYASALRRGVTLQYECRIPARAVADGDGSPPRWYAVTVIPGHDDRLIVLQRSISEYKAVLKEAVDLMNQDDLTGLANRRHLKSRFWTMRSRHSAFSLLFFDFDGFKRVNDSYGHEIGDEVLRIAARRLEQNVRPDEVVARIGGDEFAVLLRAADRPSIEGVVARLLDAIGTPMHIGDRVITLRSSAGAALYPDDGDTFDAVLRRADRRMYQQKRGDR